MSNNTKVYFNRDFNFDPGSRTYDWAREQLLAMRKISRTIFVEDSSEELLVIFTDDNDSIVTVKNNIFDVLDLDGISEIIVDEFDLSETVFYAVELEANFRMVKIK